MTSTAVLTEDSTTIVAEDVGRFSWSIAIAGAVAAIAVSFFLLTLGSGVGLAFISVPHPGDRAPATLITLGAIYFFASQAFGFAVGGYLVGRLIGPEVENRKEEEFRAAAHGFVMWAVAIAASLILVGFSSAIASASLAGGVFSAPTENARDATSRYWVDVLFHSSQNSALVDADKAEVGRILGANPLGQTNDEDTSRIARLVSQDGGISMNAAMNRVSAVEIRMRQSAESARKVMAALALWTAFALLFGAVVSVASAIAARWMDDRISFSFAPRR